MSLKSPIQTAIKEIRQPTIKAPTGMGSGRPAKVRKDPIRKLGPRFLKRGSAPLIVPDFCKPWPGFVTPTTSLPEQMLYAAFSIYFHDPVKYWEPPFLGGKDWKYQSNIQGGRLLLGGQVCDYEVTIAGEVRCYRLQSHQWHVAAEHAKQVDDLMKKTNTNGIKVLDIFEQDFVGDCTGQAAIKLVARTVSTGEMPSPLFYGTARQVRPS